MRLDAVADCTWRGLAMTKQEHGHTAFMNLRDANVARPALAAASGRV